MPDTITVYTFDELNEDAQERVVERERYRLMESGLVSDLISEHMESILDEIGLGDFKVRYSLGYSQGDGVSVLGELFLGDLPEEHPDFPWAVERGMTFSQGTLRAIAPTFMRLAEEHGRMPSVRVTSISSHYVHENTMQVDLRDDDVTYLPDYMYEDGEIDEAGYDALLETVKTEADALEGALTEYFRDVAQGLERAGYDEIEHQESDESIRNFIDANMPDARFTESGTEIR